MGLACKFLGHDFAPVAFEKTGREVMVARLWAAPEYSEKCRCIRCGLEKIEGGLAVAGDPAARSVTRGEAISLMRRESK